MKSNKTNGLDDYVYIRLGKDTKKLVRDRAKHEGSNMTIWIRQLVIRELETNAS